MDIYKIRQEVNTNIHYVHTTGATILYSRNGYHNVIKLTHDELIAELKAIGTIDEETPNVMEGFKEARILSQWDALNIAIRFEQAREMDKEIDNSDIGKAIKRITDGQRDAY